MSTRSPYRLVARAESAAKTRARILDALRRQLIESSLSAATMEETARRAGVARSTIYDAFGSRLGMFQALATGMAQTAAFRRLQAALADPVPRRAMKRSLAAGTAFYEAEHMVSRALGQLAANDPDAAGAVGMLDFGRRMAMVDLARRLSEQGQLRDGVTLPEAADMLSVLSSFATFEELRTGRSLTVRQVQSRLKAMADRSLCSG
jgi:AcrR family transcriptional regulator